MNSNLLLSESIQCLPRQPLVGGGASGASISVLMDWKANWHESSVSAAKPKFCIGYL